MRSDHSVLISGRRRPRGSCFIHGKSAERNITNSCLRRHEAIPSDIDLYLLLVGVLALEIRVDHCLTAVLLGIPLIHGPLRFP